MSSDVERDRNIIDQWLDISSDQAIVLVIGAGFSKNAVCNSTNDSASKLVPDWKELLSKINNKISTSAIFDDLLVFDLIKDFYGSSYYENALLSFLPDKEISPGRAHLALTKIPNVKYIITTNNLDTLLDKSYEHANKVISDADISKLNDYDVNIIYLHGHRKNPESWIFSRVDYEDIEKRFPVKTALVRTVLSIYPSLFIGFGHTDPNLHSIMRFVDHTMSSHKPAMLSLAVKQPNNALAKHWDKIGLSIASTNAFGCTIEESVIEAIKYISKQRLETLTSTRKILPGYRFDMSLMEALKESKFCCKNRNGVLDLCDYHASRADTEICRLPAQSGIDSISPYVIKLENNSPILELIERMRNGFKPTGSWGLMPTHRLWLQQSIISYLELNTGIEDVRIVITGIASLAHFSDTVLVIFEAFESINLQKKLDIHVIDICEGPLQAIDDFINRKPIFNSSNNQFYDRILSLLDQSLLKITLHHGDVLNYKNIKSMDIILCHHLISFWGIENEMKVRKYAEFVQASLKRNGILITALNVPTSDERILRFHDLLQTCNLHIQKAETVFDIYDAVLENFPNRLINYFARKETLLASYVRMLQP